MIKYETTSMDNKGNAHCCFGMNTQVFGPKLSRWQTKHISIHFILHILQFSDYFYLFCVFQHICEIRQMKDRGDRFMFHKFIVRGKKNPKIIICTAVPLKTHQSKPSK